MSTSVTRVMTVVVVDALEVVDIKEDHRAGAAVALARGKRLGEGGLDSPAVRFPGQHVVVRESAPSVRAALAASPSS